jgi:hypothetical protein
MTTPTPTPAPLNVVERTTNDEPVGPADEQIGGDCLDLTVEQLEQWVQTGSLPILEEWLAASPE